MNGQPTTLLKPPSKHYRRWSDEILASQVQFRSVGAGGVDRAECFCRDGDREVVVMMSWGFWDWIAALRDTSIIVIAIHVVIYVWGQR